MNHVSAIRDLIRVKFAHPRRFKMAHVYSLADVHWQTFGHEYKSLESFRAGLRKMVSTYEVRDMKLLILPKGFHQYPPTKETSMTAQAKRTPQGPPSSRAPMRIEWLHISQLFVDREVLVNPRMPEDRDAKLRKIADAWDWNFFQVPKVVHRGGNRFALLDGAGSVHALREYRAKEREMLIPCHVVDERVRTRACEAAVFTSQKNRTRLTGIDFFIGDLIAKEPEALAIHGMLREIGMTVPGDPKAKLKPWPDGFKAIPVARALYREGDLRRTLLIARACWAAASHPPDSVTLTAVGIVLKACPDLDEERLKKVLIENEPRAIQADLILKRGKMHLYMKAEALANKFVDLYDHEFRGSLIGGARLKGRYTPGLRTELADAATKIISTWKFTSRSAPSALE